jgi:hypothetical protein
MPLYNAAIRDIAMPDRMKRLPLSATGFPVPWFVDFQNGVPDFRVIKRGAVADAYHLKKCWICGQPLGRVGAMTLGLMCAINRVVSEPASHRDCAVYAAQACPFLANPRMRRNEKDLPDQRIAPPGVHSPRNPGVVAIWLTRSYRPFKTPDGGALFTFDDPERVEWFCEGRAATRGEVTASIKASLPQLAALAKEEGVAAIDDLLQAVAALVPHLPAAA